MLSPVRETGTLVASSSLLAFVEHMGQRPAPQSLVEDHRDTLAHLG
jgi:hypothetical protein